MNKYGNALLSTEDRQLLLNSLTVESYPELIPVLKKYTQIKEIDDLENVSDNIMNIFRFSIKSIVNDASKEWVQTEKVTDFGNLETKCSLCGTRTRYICYIQNVYTNKSLNVGTDCILKFPDIKSNNIKKEKQELIKLQKYNEKRVKLGLKFPNLEEDMSDLETRLVNSPIVLPKTIVDDITFMISKLRELCNDYITAVSRNSIIETITLWYTRLLNRRDSMANFININGGKPYICTNTIRNWIESTYKKSDYIINTIQEDKGYITNRTIKYIWESEFLSMHEIELKDSLKNTYLRLDKIQDYNAYFIVSLMKFKIPFLTSLGKMMKCVYLKENRCYLQVKGLISCLEYLNSTDNDMEIEELVNFVFGATDFSLGFNEYTGKYYFENSSHRIKRHADIDFETLKSDIKKPILTNSFDNIRRKLLEKTSSSDWKR